MMIDGALRKQGQFLPHDMYAAGTAILRDWVLRHANDSSRVPLVC